MAEKSNLNFITENSNSIFPPIDLRIFCRAFLEKFTFTFLDIFVLTLNNYTKNCKFEAQLRAENQSIFNNWKAHRSRTIFILDILFSQKYS